MRRTVAVACVILAACASEATPEQAFCDEAVPLFSASPELGQIEETVRSQMEELAQIASALPENQEAQVLVLIDDLNGQFESADGWSSQEVVEHVGALCDLRDELIWSTVTP